MLAKVTLLIFLSFMTLASTEYVLEQKETYNVGNEITTLSALWAGDLEGDRVPEILAGGFIFGAGITKGALVMIRQNHASTLAKIPGTSRTFVMTVCNASEDEGREIVIGSNALFVYSRAGKLLKEKSTGRDVTALEAVNFDETPLDEIIYGTSAGDVVYLVDFEPKYLFSVRGAVKFIFDRGGDAFYVVTNRSIQCIGADGEQLWSHSADEEICSAVTYDINNDSKKELIYTSGSAVYSLSFDGQETFILTHPPHPLSLLVEDITRDGKPDLILADDTGHVEIYSNLKEEVVQSLFFKQEGEIPILCTADITKDGKPDLIYGGITTVTVLENVSPLEDLMLEARYLFFQGEELYRESEYEEALQALEEAEKIFHQLGAEEWELKCHTYLEEITEILEIASAAESAVTEGDQLYSEERYQEAKDKFLMAQENYKILAQKDEYYTSFLEEAKASIDKCDLAIADQYYDTGETYLNQQQYQQAKQQFEIAEAIYAMLNSDKAQLCSQKIDVCSENVVEKEETRGEQTRSPSIEPTSMLRNPILGVTVTILALLMTFFGINYKKVKKWFSKGKSKSQSSLKHPKKREKHFKFDIAISFAGEDREIAKNLAEELRIKHINNRRVKVFYDEFYKDELWGKELTKYFQEVYGSMTRYVIVLISKYYPVKDWTDFEFSIMRAEAEKRQIEFILPVKLDETRIGGIKDDVAYLDYQREGIDGIVKCLLGKLLKHLD